MKLKDLINALAGEIELAQAQLNHNLDQLAVLDIEDMAFMDALDHYSGQAQRMGEAAEMAGFVGLHAVCGHVLENSLLLASLPQEERVPLITFLSAWPLLIVHYLRNLDDPSTAAGLIDHLRSAPSPMDEDQAMKVMHMLGAMPMQIAMPGGDEETQRPVLATPEDIALVMPDDVDEKLLEGFFQEAPEQARYLVELAHNMATGNSGNADIVAAKRVAHTLKGSASIIGLRGIAALGHHLEDILEYFERESSKVGKHVTDILLDAAFCVEQMIGFLSGADDFPQQAQHVLQAVLDLANQIDRGECPGLPSTRAASTALLSSASGTVKYRPDTSAVLQPVAAGVIAAPTAALRVSVQRIEEMFRISGEVSVHGAAMEARIKTLVDNARALLQQNLRVQKRLFELETVVDVHAFTRSQSKGRSTKDGTFDPLEMQQYSELHSTTHALVEEAADARALAWRLEDEIAQVAGVQARQQRLHKDMQHLVNSTRMTEVGVLESRLQRTVRSTCQATDKEAVLVMQGGETLIDSEVLHRLAEPLLHLLRNAVDHGVEVPDSRLAQMKPRAGRILLSFARQGQQVVLRCQDDGTGLDLPAIQNRAVERGLLAAGQAMSDDEIARLILLPGFSTRHTISEVSGRGIGLDVVREWSNAMNGSVQITSQPGEGCTIELRFAASLSTQHVLIVEVSGQRLGLPSVQVVRAVSRGLGTFELIGEQLVYRHDKRAYPAFRLAAITGLPIDAGKALEDYDAVIVRLDDKIHALAVDRLLNSRELLVKSPGKYARHMRGVAGLSILGDGGIAVNLDLAQLLKSDVRQATMHTAAPLPQLGQSTLPAVLIVDDALSVRTSLLQLVQDAGFRAEAARDGVEAIQALRTFKPDVMLTDLEMPNMNGVELTAHIRNRDDFKGLPIIMITSRSQDKHRQMAEQAGVDAYFTKPYNDIELLQTIRSAIAV